MKQAYLQVNHTDYSFTFSVHIENENGKFDRYKWGNYGVTFDPNEAIAVFENLLKNGYILPKHSIGRYTYAKQLQHKFNVIGTLDSRFQKGN